MLRYFFLFLITGCLSSLQVAYAVIEFPPDYDFGTITPGSNIYASFTINNTGPDDVQIGELGALDSGTSIFRVFNQECQNLLLKAGEICHFTVAFKPDLTQLYTDSFDIDMPGLGLVHTMGLSGTGGAVVAEPDISIAFSSTGFLDSNLGQIDVLGQGVSSGEKAIALQNLGSSPLIVNSVELATGNDGEFVIEETCVDFGELNGNDLCTVNITLQPFSEGSKSATVTVNSNDPDEAALIFTISAVAVNENDGVDALTEDGAPNNGDGNYDGIPDSSQSNVVSLPDLSGRYITYFVDNKYRISGFMNSSPDSFSDIPEDVGIGYGIGITDFTVTDATVGETVRIGVIMQPQVHPSAFYVYGPEDDGQDASWFDFVSDGETGTAIVAGGVLVTDDDVSVPGSYVTLILSNAGRGDVDRQPDDALNIRGGFVATTVSDDSGNLSLILSPLLFIVLILRKRRYGRA